MQKGTALQNSSGRQVPRTKGWAAAPTPTLRLNQTVSDGVMLVTDQPLTSWRDKNRLQSRRRRRCRCNLRSSRHTDNDLVHRPLRHGTWRQHSCRRYLTQYNSGSWSAGCTQLRDDAVKVSDSQRSEPKVRRSSCCWFVTQWVVS